MVARFVWLQNLPRVFRFIQCDLRLARRGHRPDAVALLHRRRNPDRQRSELRDRTRGRRSRRSRRKTARRKIPLRQPPASCLASQWPTAFHHNTPSKKHGPCTSFCLTKLTEHFTPVFSIRPTVFPQKTYTTTLFQIFGTPATFWMR